MVSVREVSADKFIEKAASELEKMNELKPPEWTSFVKTGIHKERPPTQKNWWWVRSASIMRKLHLKQDIGVSRLKKIYGGRKNRGVEPEHKYKASGKIIRNILQQLESVGYVKTEKKKGRSLTPKGKKFLNDVAKSLKQA
jgi:small subunit ribosomal protein S19e